MMLPTKGISPERALLTVGAEILEHLERSDTPSGVWERFKAKHSNDSVPITYDWFMLALTLVYAMGLIDMNDRGLLRRGNVPVRNRVERPALQGTLVP